MSMPVFWLTPGTQVIYQSNAVKLDGDRVVFDDGGWTRCENCFFTEEQCRKHHGLPDPPQPLKSYRTFNVTDKDGTRGVGCLSPVCDILPYRIVWDGVGGSLGYKEKGVEDFQIKWDDE